MKKILFLILLISLMLFSIDLFADTNGDKEEIDCMGVVMPFNQEGANNNVIIEVSVYPGCVMLNQNPFYFVQYSDFSDNNSLYKYNLPVLYFPGIGNNVAADTKIMCMDDTCYHMRC